MRTIPVPPPVPRRWRRFFHVRKGQPYREENSIRGIHKAKRIGRIDLDGRVSKDGVVGAIHSRRPYRDGFRSPTVPKRARFDELTWEQIRTLRSPDGYVIHKMAHLICVAALVDVGIELETKRGARAFADAETWVQIREAVDHCGADLQVKCQSDVPGCGRFLERAQEAGFITFILRRGPIRSAWVKFADYMRGNRN